MQNTHPMKIERLRDALKRTGMSRAWTYAAIKRGEHPRQVQLSSRAVGFLSHEIDAWIAARAAQRPS